MATKVRVTSDSMAQPIYAEQRPRPDKPRRVRAKGTKAPRNVAVVLLVLWLVALVGGVYVSLDDDQTLVSASKSHECTSDVIQATVSDQGQLQVVDSRTYDFTGSYELSAITLDPPEGGDYTVTGVSVIDSEGVQTELTEVEFQEQWRTSGGPGDGYYAVDTDQDTIYAFSATADSTKTFVFAYTYTNAVEVYNDAAVLYWQFIPSSWDVDSNDVSMTLTLPVADGDVVDGGDNVLAFGHSESSGDVLFNDDGTIDFTLECVEAGTFAEARVTFPASWIAEDAEVSRSDEDVLETILDEEQQWTDETRLQNLLAVLPLLLCLLISIALIAYAACMFLRHGKEHKPQFDGDYWRDVPDERLHPVVVARLWRWGDKDDNDLTATLMHLSAAGVVGIERIESRKERLLRSDTMEQTYQLYRRDEAKLAAMTDIDRQAFKLVFEDIGGGASTVSIDQIQDYAQRNPSDFVSQMKGWQDTVTAKTDELELFEPAGEKLKTRFVLMSLLIGVVGFIVSLVLHNFIVLAALAPGVAFMFGIAFAMPRRSAQAVEVQARSEALKRWFRDFTALDEAVPTDTLVWGQLLVYAYLFGVAEQVAQDLDYAVPGIWDDTGFKHISWWYHRPRHLHHGPAPACADDFFGDCFANTVKSADAAIASAAAMKAGASNLGGVRSKGLGGGGGFTRGGGGGFGGRGGGFSR